MRTLTAVITALASLSLAGCIEITDSARFEAPFHYSYDLAPGGRLNLESTNGSVEITGWDQNNIDISGTKFASTQALLDRIRIEIHNDPNSVEIRTVRPDEPFASAGAKYIIRVPRSALIDQITTTNASIRLNDVSSGAHLRTTNGTIRAGNLKGMLDAQTRNGSILLDGISGGVNLRTTNGRIEGERIDGECRAHTSNGPIELAFVRAPGQGVRAETSNGGITLRLPSETSARLEAHTNRGSISTEVNVNGQVHAGRNELEGNLGSGGPLIELSTTNGSIRLLRS